MLSTFGDRVTSKTTVSGKFRGSEKVDDVAAILRVSQGDPQAFRQKKKHHLPVLEATKACPEPVRLRADLKAGV